MVRITAKTKFAAYEDFASEHAMLENIADSAKQKGIKNIDTKVEAAYKTMRDMQKEIDNLKNQIFTLKSKEWATEAKDFGKVNVLIKSVSGMDADALKDIVSNLKASDDKMVVESQIWLKPVVRMLLRLMRLSVQSQKN